MNLRLRRILRSIWSAWQLLASIPTRCPHRNRHNLYPYLQACMNCGRVRYTDNGATWSVWHRDGVR